ncbi:MAG: DUF2786 domain-containing protein [Acidimicrobiales bacterium]
MPNHFTPHRPPEDPDELDAGLVALITYAWQIGWMPGDLLAMVDHDLTPTALRLAATLILREHEVQGYGDRLSPRWQVQINHVRNVAGDDDEAVESRHRGWRTDRLELWSRLAFLPGLRQLGPLPGEADASAPRSVGDASPATGGALDHDILRKVRAMLAKAESSAFEAEAEAFTAKAQALITDHSLADALRSAAGSGPHTGPDAIRLAVERPYDREKFGLLSVIARSNRATAIRHSGLGLATVIGYTIDLEATELLFTSLLVQASRAMLRHGSTTDGYGKSTTRAFRRSFLIGFAGRIDERLSAENARATERAAATTAADGPLLPVLASRAAAVDRMVDEVFPSLSRLRPSHATFDGSGYGAGVAAANRADLAARRPLAS